MTGFFVRLSGRVAVVGSGLAGLVTALRLSPHPVVLLTRAGLGAESSTAWAQGGIAACLGADDTTALHLADTLAAGDGLCNTKTAASIVDEAQKVIALLEKLGVRFDRSSDGSLLLGLEAAHCRRRIMHVEGDGSGAAIVRALVAAVLETPSITVLEGIEARRLLMTDGKISGLLCATGDGPRILATTRVVLATGGLGGLYDATTNPTGNYGQGIMLAARAGADLADMEFVQFHPTALVSNHRPLALVSEAVRGDGAILVNEKGERFLAAQPGAELAPRDMVARAVSAEIARGGRVFLDARSALGENFAHRFPMIANLCRNEGINAAQERIPVCAAAHYHMGGVATDLQGRTTLEGLWVVGEAASTGLHGANRLASNSLLEAAVLGMRAAEDIAGTSAGPMVAPPPAGLPPPADISMIRPIVSRHLGVLRNEDSISSAIAGLLPHIESEGVSADPAIVALSIAVFAWLRRESRGAHARTDFPLKLVSTESRKLTFGTILEVANDIASHSPSRCA